MLVAQNLVLEMVAGEAEVVVCEVSVRNGILEITFGVQMLEILDNDNGHGYQNHRN